jgi:hypothetical protein
VKKVVEKIKEERAERERENSLFFVFLSSCRLAGAAGRIVFLELRAPAS